MKEFISKIENVENMVLMFDHELGGGSNQYRERKISQYINQGMSVLLCLSQHQLQVNTAKLIYFSKIENVESSCSLSVGILSYLTKLSFKQIFINSIVSFKPVTTFLIAFAAFIKQTKTESIYVAFHDFYAICPSYNLLNYQWEFCNVPDNSICINCRNNHDITTLREPSVELWRSLWNDILMLSTQILVFSQSSKNIILKAFPEISEQLAICPHSMDYFVSQDINVKPHQLFNIGVVGDIKIHKGSKVVIQLSEYLTRLNISANIIVFGQLESTITYNNINILGAYKNTELAELIKKNAIDAFLFPSVCPETFSYVIEELMLLKQTIVCFDIGAQGEKIAQYKYGNVLPVATNMKTLAETLIYQNK